MTDTKKKGHAEAQPTSKSIEQHSSTDRPLYLPLRWNLTAPAHAGKGGEQCR